MKNSIASTVSDANLFTMSRKTEAKRARENNFLGYSLILRFLKILANLLSIG